MGLHAAPLQAIVMLREPCHRLFRGGNSRPWRYGGTSYHIDRHPKRARRLDLGYRGRSARIFGENSLYAVFKEQADIILGGEGSASSDDDGIRQGMRRFRHINQPDDVPMLRGSAQLGKSEPPHAAKNRPGLRPNCRHGSSEIRDVYPVIFWLSFPGRPLDREEGNIRRGGGFDRVAAHAAGERVGGVNEDANVLLAQMTREAGSAAKSACSNLYWLRHWRSGPAGKRQSGIEARVRGEQSRKRARFRRTSQDENTHGSL